MADQRSYFVPFDLDTGAGTEYVIGVNLRLSASGGSIEALGQQAMLSSIPVVIASNQSAVAVDTELPAAAALTDNFANPTAPAVGAFGMLWDGATWDRMPGTSADGVLVNTELPAAAALADAMANPTVPGVGAFSLGFNGTTWDRVRTANTGRLQVDVVTGGGSDTPTNPVINTQTSTSIAPATPTNIDSAEAAGKKLRKIDVWSSVAWKGEIFTVDNAVESTRKGVIGGSPGQSVQFVTPHRNYITLGTTAGADTFRLKFTNLDDTLSADAHVVFFYED